MKTIITKLLKEQLVSFKRNRTLIKEDTSFNGKTIINVDIQPEYQKNISFSIYQWISFLNSSSDNNRIIFLYNGDSLGMISETEYIDWLIENGLNIP